MNFIMTTLQSLMPPWVVIACWSGVASVMVMLLYRRLSPQDKMTGILLEMEPLRKQMLSLDANPEDATTASFRYLCLSLKRMGIAVIPMLVSSLPGLLVWAALDGFYQQASVTPYVLSVEAGWPGHWLSVFVFFSILFSLALKILWRIK